jgi:acyl-coenzyme A synthetase/AMP-(fatty) acid ligase
LSKLLPSYMLPSSWKEFDRLPRNVNGKIDRALLRQLFQGPS